MVQYAVGDKNFCLEERDGNFFLKQDHSYLYQVCECNCMQTVYMIYYPSLHAGAMPAFLHFVTWTEEDIHFECIYPVEFFWMENVSRVKQFFNTAILPELVGNFYSRGQNLVVPQNLQLNHHHNLLLTLQVHRHVVTGDMAYIVNESRPRGGVKYRKPTN